MFLRRLLRSALTSALGVALLAPLGGCGVGSSTRHWEEAPETASLLVDGSAGDDATADGSQEKPFRTISQALASARGGDRVQVLPGLYDADHGESFPLSIPAGVHLVGNEAGKGLGDEATVIVGHGPAPESMGRVTATVVPSAHSLVAGFVITNDAATPGFVYDVGIAIGEAAVHVRNCTIRACADDGIRFHEGAMSGVIERNVLEENGVGLDFRFGGEGTRVEHNTIRRNGWGIGVQAGVAGDLGGGPAGSAGHNILTENTTADLVVMADAAADVHAANNHWDHPEPVIHEGEYAVPAGVDIWLAFGGTVQTQ